MAIRLNDPEHALADLDLVARQWVRLRRSARNPPSVVASLSPMRTPRDSSTRWTGGIPPKLAVARPRTTGSQPPMPCYLG